MKVEEKNLESKNENTIKDLKNEIDELQKS